MNKATLAIRMEVVASRHLGLVQKKGHHGKAGSTVMPEAPKPFAWDSPTFGAKQVAKWYSEVFPNVFQKVIPIISLSVAASSP